MFSLLLSLFMTKLLTLSLLFFFNDTATTEIYTLSLHDALPICWRRQKQERGRADGRQARVGEIETRQGGIMHYRFGIDRKSTRLNSSHLVISYAVFCLKKKKKKDTKSAGVSTM